MAAVDLVSRIPGRPVSGFEDTEMPLSSVPADPDPSEDYARRSHTLAFDAASAIADFSSRRISQTNCQDRAYPIQRDS
jgi:hypothetical protein